MLYLYLSVCLSNYSLYLLSSIDFRGMLCWCLLYKFNNQESPWNTINMQKLIISFGFCHSSSAFHLLLSVLCKHVFLGSLTIKSNSTFGIFPLGKSVIAYTATDAVGLERTCFINIHVQGRKYAKMTQEMTSFSLV